MKDFTSGQYIKQGSYRSFQPEKINRKWVVENMELLTLLSQADREIGKLDMFSEYVPDINLFIGMHVLKEATKSSKIEGTKTNIKEALLDKEDISEEKRDDWEEVQNYVQALNQAIDKLKELPFSSRLIKQTHKILLSGVRGKHKLPGDYRISQNWIGGASTKDAIFIPPTHSTVGEYMSDLEKFAHTEEYLLPELLKIALIHYQFETIHPFLDGNGRVGRLMITLYMVEKGLLKKPILYLSDFFEKNRSLYYDNLMLAREQSDILQWFKFFLVGVIETAKSSIDTFDQILKLQKDVELRLQQINSKTRNANLIIQSLYQNPIIYPQKAKNLTGLSSPTIYKLMKDLEKVNILKEITRSKKGKMYVFEDYLKIFES